MTNTNQAPAGCDAVMTHLSRSIPDTLWHYTSFVGFQGIISSKAIWATEYRFLNDSEEFAHARTLAETLAEEVPEFTDLQFPARATIRSAVNMAFSTGFLDPERFSLMVSSFSEVGDQLSQWRGYAGSSTGVSIGLDLRHLRPASALQTTVVFAPCVYAEGEKKDLLGATLKHYQDKLEAAWNSTLTSGLMKNINYADTNAVWDHIHEHSKEISASVAEAHTNLQWDLLRLAPLLKNESFSEEREWRLTLPREAIRLPSRHPLRFRYQYDTLVPYIAYPLLLQNQEGPILCREVIIGPGSHSAAEIGTNMFLLSEQIPIAAKRSTVPYRPGR
jgi:hypothetical protein